MEYRELITLGLGEKESKTYLAALELGQTTAQKIAEKSGVNRASVYVAIEILMQKGLMSSVNEGKKQYFIAESPEKLSLLFREEAMTIQRKQEYLDEILPKLKSINNNEKDKPVVRYYEGKEGVRAMVEDMFTAKEGSEIYMAYCIDNIDKNFTEIEKKNWRDKRIKNNLQVNSIYTSSNRNHISADKTISKIIPFKNYPLKSDIAVYENKIRLASLEKKLVGIIIENQELADSVRAILKLAFEAADKFN